MHLASDMGIPLSTETFSVTNQFLLLLGSQASHMFSSQFVTLSEQVTVMQENESWKEAWVYIFLFAQQNA